MKPSSLPPLFRVRQSLEDGEITDTAAAVADALDTASLRDRIHPGMSIAITAGSRGIDRIGEVLRAAVDWLRAAGGEPFVVAAMGSHGWGTAQGRKDMLSKVGINEEIVKAPVLTQSETVVIGQVEDIPVHCVEEAVKADGIVVINRIKPHTSFTGRYESGLVKMLTVGLGLAPGATAIHARGARGLSTIVPEMARVVLGKLPVLFGLALIENGCHRLKEVAAIPAEGIMDQEPLLLDQTRPLQPGLPFDRADLLVVDRFGKDLSGTGMDTRVIGRMLVSGESEPELPRINRIAALRLTPASHGSAYGVGLADVTTEAVIRAMDPDVTRTNALTSTFLERARIPLVFPTDQEAILAAAATCGNPYPQRLLAVRIQDTLHLSELMVSGTMLPLVSGPTEVVEGPLDWFFDDQGNLDMDSWPSD